MSRWRRRRPYWDDEDDFEYIPVPSGVDPIKILQYADRMYRRADTKKDKKKDDGCPKCKEGKEGKEKIWKYIQLAAVLYLLAPFAILLQHQIANVLTQAINH